MASREGTKTGHDQPVPLRPLTGQRVVVKWAGRRFVVLKRSGGRGGSPAACVFGGWARAVVSGWALAPVVSRAEGSVAQELVGGKGDPGVAAHGEHRANALIVDCTWSGYR